VRLRAASFRVVARPCYFLPRGGGQADRVRAVDLAANNVGLPLDVLRRPDAAPPAVLGVVVAQGAGGVTITPAARRTAGVPRRFPDRQQGDGAGDLGAAVNQL
jgi:hypothetical protein